VLTGWLKVGIAEAEVEALVLRRCKSALENLLTSIRITISERKRSLNAIMLSYQLAMQTEESESVIVLQVARS
jgi:hypothetical protein